MADLSAFMALMVLRSNVGDPISLHIRRDIIGIASVKLKTCDMTLVCACPFSARGNFLTSVFPSRPLGLTLLGRICTRFIVRG